MLEFEVVDWGFFSICLLIYYLGNAENMLNDAQAWSGKKKKKR